jgi:hypothetical protein
MADRVKENEDLRGHAGRTIIFRPLIIIEMTDDNEPLYRLHLQEVDEHMNRPEMFGIVLSDLLDHLAHAFHRVTGRDQRDIRRDIEGHAGRGSV